MSGNTNTDIWIAGAFAAFSVDLLVYPLDTLKTRIQSPDYRRLYVNESTNTIKKAALFRGLYQGLGSVVLATLPSSGAFFTTYEGVKFIGESYNSNGLVPAPIIHSLASGTAELVSCAILTPAEVIKQNAQMVSAASARSAGATMQTIRRFKNNPLALWRGYGALAGRNLPFTALQFPLFEKLKEMIRERRRTTKHDQHINDKSFSSSSSASHKEQLSLLEHAGVTAVAAGTAGSVAAVITTPVDVVKTRIMLTAASTFADQDVKDIGKQAAQKVKDGKFVDALGAVRGADSTSGKSKTKSSWTIAREIINDQGYKGLMRGGALRAVWTMLGSGLYLGVYEGGRLYLERERERKQE